ncbi:uncharacterized protein LOC106156225 isoform X2 [Lingula anatina]|uniref:Uncharacterized protein LOC106156225 isoform X2 n=1 Tax=Lingula anatina TaxID=7574 RepID=A0A1S3HP46_LINAN|nr:uncharacterized protein LOC106156225 isoform X2 [Lingula anatina]|eukprot:XP_013386809.1 uncharacterized protein LOC106156225 isoform X2 [Lingula anatina]
MTALPAQQLPNSGTRLEAYITHVVAQGKSCIFWAQIDAPAAHQVETAVETAVAGLESDQTTIPQPSDLHPGDLCLAQSQEDQKWYRARVEGLNPDENAARVYFIDYGNVEAVSLSNIRLKNSCFSLPAQAFQCVLANFGPTDNNQWSAQETEHITGRLEYCECAGLVLDTVQSSQGSRLVMELYKDLQSPELLIAELISHGCGEAISDSCGAAVNAPSDNVRTEIRRMELEQNVQVDVYISHSEGPCLFWVQLSSEEDKLMKVMAELEKSDSFPSLQSAEVGAFCVAKYSEDGAFYRARVTTLLPDDMCEVHFVDYGNSEFIAVNALKQIPENMCSLPCQAISCKVPWKLEPEIFQELVQDKLLHAKAIAKTNHMYSVQLWSDDGSLERAVQSGTGASPSGVLGASGQIEGLVISEESHQQSSSPAASSIPSPDVTQGATETLYISAISSIHSFYGQLCKYPTETLDNFMQQLNDHYGSNTVPDLFSGGHTPQPGDIGCAQFSGDDMWYRVRVLGARADGEVEIQFLDYGNKETKQMGEVKCLVQPYLSLPQQGINCCFPNLPPGLTVEGLEELLLEKTIHVCITEKMGDIHEVSLTEHPDNAELLKVFPPQGIPAPRASTAQQASPGNTQAKAESKSDLDLDFIKPAITVGDGQRHQLQVVHVQDPEDFYCHLQHSMGQLDQLMEDIDVYCNSLQPGEGQLQTYGLGIPCIAQYSVDSGWYRAVITGVKRDGKAEVTFVDYGNNETVPQENLKSIPPQFLKLPIQGIHCSLSDVHCFEDNWPQQQVKAFEEATAEHVYTALFDSYVKNEELFSVELFDANGQNFNEQFGSSCGKLNKRRTPVKLPPERETVRQQSPFGGGSGSPGSQQGGARSSPGGQSSGRPGSGRPSPGRPPSNRSSPGRPLSGRPSPGGSSSGNSSRMSPGRGHHQTQVPTASTFASAFVSLPLRDGEFKDMRAVYTLNPSEFYCHLHEQEELIDHLMNALQDKYKTMQHTECTIDNPQVGMPCVAWYPEDKHWYRAQLKSVDDSITTVQYVDFGNCETISVNRIKELLPQFMDMPAQAVKCSLHNVRPLGREWNKQATDKLEELLGEDTKVVSLVSKMPDGGYSVEVLDTSKPGDDMINKVLVEQGFAQTEHASPPSMPSKGRGGDSGYREERRGYEPPPRMVGRQVKSPPRGDVQPREDRKPRGPHHTYGVPKPYTDLTFDSGQKVDVISSWVLSPHEFWVQLVESQNSLMELMEAIEQRYSSLQDAEEVLLNVVQGAACVAQYAKDGGWYRGLVQGIRGNQVQVYFVDYGNSELIPRAKVKETNPQLLQLPLQGIKCKLKGVEPIGREWLIDAGVLLEDLIGESATCYILAKTKDVHLVDIQSSEGKSAADELIAAGVAKQYHKEGSDASSHRSSGSGASSGFGRHQSDRRDGRMDKRREQRSGASPRQSSHGSRSSSISDDSSRGPPFDTSDGWQPTRSVQNQGGRRDDNRRFGGRDAGGRDFGGGGRDTGGRDFGGGGRDAGGRDFGGGGRDFRGGEERGFGARQGNNRRDDGGGFQRRHENRDSGYQSRQGTDSRFQRGQDRHGSGRFQDRNDGSGGFGDRGNRGDGFRKGGGEGRSGGQPPSPSRGKGTWDGSGDIIIKPSEAEWGDGDDFLPVHTETASQTSDLAYKETNLGVGDAQDVLVSHIENPGHFYVQLNSQAAELDKLMWGIEEYYSKLGLDQDIFPNPSVGNPCAAKFSEDNMWYRAVVTSVVSPTQVDVHFVDYGNSEVVQTDNVKKVKKEYLNLQAQAVKCALSRFTPVSLAQTTTEFSKLVVGKDISCKCIEKKGDTCQVELTVKGSGVNVNEELGKLYPSEISSAEFIQGEPGYISHVASPSNFCVQLTKDEPKLNNLVERLNVEYSAMTAEERLLPRVNVGQLCCAKFSEDGAWYRASVTDVTDSQVVVRFIDFGNRDNLTLDNIKEMKAEYVDTPALAIQCSLAKTNPVGDGGSWSQEACAKFQEMTSDQEIKVIFKSEVEPYNVRVLKGETDIGKELVALGFATEKPASRRSSTHSVEIQDPATLSGRKIQPPVIPVNQTAKAYISHVETPTCFFVQLSGVEKELDPLMSQLESTCSVLGPDENKLVSPEPGVACCAQYSEDQAWYRAVITSREGDMARVCFVDYGNCESTKVSSLKSLSADLAKKPIMAIRSTLMLSDGSDLPEEVTQQLLEKTQDKELLVTFLTQSEPCLVVLKDSEGKDIDIGLPAPVVTAGAHVTVPKGPAFPTFKMPSLAEEKKESVYVTHVNSPSQFWCQLTRGEDQLSELMTQIAEHYNSLPYTEIQKKVSVPCMAKYSEDGAWYRAKILRPGLRNCDVIFVDYGNVENVSMTDIRPMEKKFLELEVQAVECALQGVRSPQGPWSKEAKARFQEIVADKKLIADIVMLGTAGEDNTDLGCMVNLLDMGISVAVKLIEEGLAEKTGSLSEGSPIRPKPADSKTLDISDDDVLQETADQQKTATGGAVVDFVDAGSKYQPVMLKDGEKREVFVSFVSSPSQFWIQFKEQQDQLDHLMEQLSEQYSDDTPAVASQSTGMPCVAKFEEDQAWYRAVILELKDDQALIQYVDYGNQVHVPLTEVKPMKSELMSLPSQAVECLLTGVRSEGTTWTPEAIDTFTELTTDKTLLCEVESVGDDWSCMVKLLDMGMSIAGMMIEAGVAGDAHQPLNIARKTVEYTSPFVEEGSKLQVFVSASTNPAQFYCQLASSSNDLPILRDTIQDLYSQLSESQNCLENPAPGKPCVAQFSEDGGWYRGVVTGVRDEGVDVTFVDYGNHECVEPSKVKDLQREVSRLPIQAIKCKLSGICPVGERWDPDSMTRFEELTCDKNLDLTVVSVDRDSRGNVESILVDLYDGDLSVAQALIDAGYGKAMKEKSSGAGQVLDLVAEGSEGASKEGSTKGPLPCHVDYLMGSVPRAYPDPGSPTSSTTSDLVDALIDNTLKDACAAIYAGKLIDTAVERVSIDLQFKLPQFEPAETVQVRCVSIESPHLFCVQLVSEELSRLMPSINRYCDAQAEPTEEGKIGQACLGMSARDGQWYRGVVVKQLGDTHEVKFVDYGTMEVIPKNLVCNIPDEFRELPVQTLLCRLSGVSPPGGRWSTQAIAYFKELCQGKTLIARVSDTEVKDMYSVYLYDPTEDTTQSINQMLTKEGHADMVPGSDLELDMEAASLEESGAEVLEQSFCEVSLQRFSSLGEQPEDGADNGQPKEASRDPVDGMDTLGVTQLAGGCTSTPMKNECQKPEDLEDEFEDALSGVAGSTEE